MLSRAVLLVLAAFWLTMNVLLWRAEYGGHPGLGSSVPAHLVWEKLLTAPDSSSLAIYRHGQRIGYCHWITGIGQTLARPNSSGAPPEGMVPNIANYHLELEGNLFVAGPAERLRFDTQLILGADQQWREFDLRLNMRPGMWQVHSSAAEQRVRIAWQDHGDKFERVLTFADLQHPEALLQEFGGPIALAMWSGLGLQPANAPKSQPSWRVDWEARLESIRLGHSSVRAYRLEAHLVDRFAVVVFVSRAGEILRIELPDQIMLTNDQLGGN